MYTGAVSIIIPTYNEDPDHLVQAVDSALAQTYPDVEVIVVDDGTTRSDTLQTLRRLTGVTLVRQPNSGPGEAMNTGVRRATGEFILSMGGDDWIEPEVARLLVDALTGDDVVGAFPLVRRFGAGEGVQHAPAVVRFEDIAISNVVVATCLYRRRDWERVGGYHKVDFVSEDWLMWLKLLGTTRGRMVQVPEAVLHYRLRPGSRSRARRTKPGAVQHGIVEMMPEMAGELYVAAAMEGQALKREVEVLRAFHNAWSPRVRPLLKLRDMLLRRRSRFGT